MKHFIISSSRWSTRHCSILKHQFTIHYLKHTHSRFTAVCLGLPGWASMRRDIHPLTPETCRGSLSSFWILGTKYAGLHTWLGHNLKQADYNCLKLFMKLWINSVNYLSKCACLTISWECLRLSSGSKRKLRRWRWQRTSVNHASLF